MRLRLDLARWLSTRAVILAGLVLLAAQIAWTAALLAHSYFRQDDFGILDRAAASGFSWNYLIRVGGAGHGHLMPVGLAISWALARAPLYDWLLASVVIGVLVATASLALLRLLVISFGARPAILVPLAVYMFGPLSLAAVGWWSAALEVLPLRLAIFAASAADIRYLRSVSLGRGRWRHAIAAAAWLAVGMASADQGALVPLLLLAITAGYFVPGGWTFAVRQAVTTYWRAWLSYAAVLACYCAVFFFQLARSGLRPADPGLASKLYQFAGTLIGQAALAGPASRPRGCRDVTAAGTSIALDGSLYQWPWTARLSYSGPAGLLAVGFGGTPNQVRLPAGHHVVYVPVVGDGSTVSLQFAGRTSRALCVTGVTVGSLHPERAGRAVPAAPVPG